MESDNESSGQDDESALRSRLIRQFGLSETAAKIVELDMLVGTPGWPAHVDPSDRSVAKMAECTLVELQRIRSTRKYLDAVQALVFEEVTHPLKIRAIANTLHARAISADTSTTADARELLKLIDQIKPVTPLEQQTAALDDLTGDQLVELLTGYCEMLGWKVAIDRGDTDPNSGTGGD